MTTIVEIRDKAVSAVEAKITDAFIAVNLFEMTQGAWDAGTGSYTAGETDHGAMKMVVQTERPIADQFPDYIAAPGDQLVLLIGNVAPSEGWELRGAKTWVVRQVQDILGNGTMFNLVVRTDG